ncbi:uncharacterized protein N7511_008935 [Penicillium nucicola]|uniref:uncharacterized protein n=1 Tax=Penicillium nucicola TaxID=1850975 RepID=UPI002545B004|nr:uncharacterized protein N7511_008935 [Penicillium nucicola]KAJ5747239.1 hypothetical protein N7511_008935 [Penicillium nucicola]
MFGGRLLLDLHLLTVFRRRHDFQWARREVLISTKRLVIAFASMIVLEHLGVPVVTYVKPIAVVILHMSGALAFLLPASYALAFDKIKTIRE